MANILITGGAGNVGSSLAARFIKNPENFVVIVDDISTGSMEKLPSKEYKNWKFVKADANNFEDIAPVLLHYGFDYVFHYAAVVGVQRTLNNPIKVLKDVDGIKHILNLSKSTGVKRVFFSSSSEVYGEPFEIPQREETTPLNSRLPYAIVKNIGEAYLKSYQQEFGLDYTIFRFFNTYGPNQSADFVISRFIQLAHRGKDITIYGDGSQTRTFCYIDDNTEVAEKCITEQICINETLNVGNDNEMTIVELANKIITQLGSSSKIIHLPPLPEGDMKRRCPDISRMKQIIGRPLTTLEEGIEKTAKVLNA